MIKLWAIPDSSTAYQLVYDRMVRMDDADGYANTAEVPFRFYPCLSAGLAYYLAIKRAPERVQLLKAIYEGSAKIVMFMPIILQEGGRVWKIFIFEGRADRKGGTLFKGRGGLWPDGGRPT